MTYRRLLRSAKRFLFGRFLPFLAFFTFLLVLRSQPLYKLSNARDYDVMTHENGSHFLFQNAQATVGHCSQARRDFVYVKMIKCASETLASMFRRFGYHRYLSFVLPIGRKIYVGWPYQIHDDMYRHTGTNRFNILTDHAIYNKLQWSLS